VKIKKVGNFTIKYDNSQVFSITINGKEIRSLIQEEMKVFNIKFNKFRPIISKIELPEGIHKLATDIFHLIKQLSNEEEMVCLTAYLATYFFDSFNNIWEGLLSKGYHVVTTKFYEAIIQLALDWESSPCGCHIHKGSPYFFLAYTYLMYGDIDKGFIYMYNAIEDDIYLNELCPSLNYPDNAPVYKTACLKDDRYNAMYPLVVEVRNSLKRFIERYNNQLGRNLNVETIDQKFLTNKSLEEIKYYFVYTFWRLNEIYFKIRKELIRNDFSKLQCLNLFFNLCLVLDKLLQRNSKFGKDTLGENIQMLCGTKKWLSRDENKEFRKAIGWQSNDIDIIISKLLSKPKMPNGKGIVTEAQYLLIAWKLRNYGGHNITSQSILVKEFDRLCDILMSCIFLAIEEI